MAQALKVAVIGGGLAGLSTATKLAEHGIDVTVFESSSQLGGRARKVVWKDQVLDNGQHILLGAYHRTLALMESVGIDLSSAFFRLPLSLHIPDKFKLQACKYLPAPLHLLLGLCLAKGLSWLEKLQAIRFFIWLKCNRFALKNDEPLLALLNRKKQSPKLIELLWEPLCLAALNTPMATASAQVYLNVLRDSFNSHRRDSDLLLPKTDLSSLLSIPMASFIQQHGGKIQLNQRIRHIKKSTSGFTLESDDKQSFEFSQVVVATAAFHIDDLGLNLDITGLSYQPIYTIYIQYPKNIQLPGPMTGLTNGLSQWVFDRGLICGQQGLIAVIISAEGPHQALTQQALAERVKDEMSSTFGLPKPLWSKVIAEKRATFSCEANLQRPSAKTKIADLYLAGDYVAGDYPATIEGAIQSGLACASMVMSQAA